MCQFERVCKKLVNSSIFKGFLRLRKMSLEKVIKVVLENRLIDKKFENFLKTKFSDFNNFWHLVKFSKNIFGGNRFFYI